MASWAAHAQLSRADSLFMSNGGDPELIETVSKLDPNKAAMLSAVLPGLGQAYNNQYWKIPIIYGGGLILAHYIAYNNRIYNEFRNALVAEVDDNSNTVDPYSAYFSSDALENNRDAFRKYRDELIIITAAYYFLNIIDAHVSAHLSEFDLNEKLSIQVAPAIQTTPVFSRTADINVGFSVCISFK